MFNPEMESLLARFTRGRIVLNGERLIIAMGYTDEIQFYAGCDLSPNSSLIDPVHRRVYLVSRTIRLVDPPHVIIREVTIAHQELCNGKPLDRKNAIGTFTESDVAIILRKPQNP